MQRNFQQTCFPSGYPINQDQSLACVNCGYYEFPVGFDANMCPVCAYNYENPSNNQKYNYNSGNDNVVSIFNRNNVPINKSNNSIFKF